ncbi:mitochondrial import receptor subunit tom-20 [Paracoccidioides lutzii Pb01]|uniref:Mitochondrial import receptor subunit TOM20 n=1 Tax=Paracoccidioides lutzii (strain ATCC MYA-826 / Pb01) TaxID=502779 RepID=C1H3A1_PARBA|nr:mitochondrial import receptor subunit tom-20 [Paracoccidioides lutzii Pb01]EEH34195.2 mitochondrial import receptor subunit tom-20 [Paracoccidioides lutzii Pb01]
MKTTTIIAASAGTILTGFLVIQFPRSPEVGVGSVYQSSSLYNISALTNPMCPPAYAIYFDYKRHSDAEFRRNLKRDNRRLARVVREQSEAKGAQQIAEIKQALQEAKEEGFPSDPEDKEAFFMGQIAKGEQLAAEGTSNLEAALAFYKALKVYPQPKDLIAIYDNTVPKDVLEILAEMVGQDTSLQLGSFTSGGSGSDYHGVE